MKELAQDSHGFSDQISETVTQARVHVTQGRAAAVELASSDQGLALASQGRLETITTGMSAVNASVAEHLARAAAVAKTIDQGVGLSITALQFEDLLSQVADQIDQRLLALEPLATRLASAIGDMAEDPSPAGIAGVLGELQRATAARTDSIRRTVEQVSMAPGDVTLF